MLLGTFVRGRNIDDGIGPSTDEYFTSSIGGMATLLNNSECAPARTCAMPSDCAHMLYAVCEYPAFR